MLSALIRAWSSSEEYDEPYPNLHRDDGIFCHDLPTGFPVASKICYKGGSWRERSTSYLRQSNGGTGNLQRGIAELYRDHLQDSHGTTNMYPFQCYGRPLLASSPSFGIFGRDISFNSRNNNIIIFKWSSISHVPASYANTCTVTLYRKTIERPALWTVCKVDAVLKQLHTTAIYMFMNGKSACDNYYSHRYFGSDRKRI